MPAELSALSSEVSTPLETADLRRVLRMRDLVMLVIGTVIGSGIFLAPAAVLRPLGGSVSLAPEQNCEVKLGSRCPPAHESPVRDFAKAHAPLQTPRLPLI